MFFGDLGSRGVERWKRRCDYLVNAVLPIALNSSASVLFIAITFTPSFADSIGAICIAFGKGFVATISDVIVAAHPMVTSSAVHMTSYKSNLVFSDMVSDTEPCFELS